jgi:hypothetical protein
MKSPNEINDRLRDFSQTSSGSPREKLKRGKSVQEEDYDPEKDEEEDYDRSREEVTSSASKKGSSVERLTKSFSASTTSKMDSVVHHALIPPSGFSFSKKTSSREEDKRQRKTSPEISSVSSSSRDAINSITSDTIFLEEGSQSVMMWCRISCNPKVTLIHWLFNGSPLNSDINASLSGLTNNNKEPSSSSNIFNTEHQRIHSSDQVQRK